MVKLSYHLTYKIKFFTQFRNSILVKRNKGRKPEGLINERTLPEKQSRDFRSFERKTWIKSSLCGPGTVLGPASTPDVKLEATSAFEEL